MCICYVRYAIGFWYSLIIIKYYKTYLFLPPNSIVNNYVPVLKGKSADEIISTWHLPTLCRGCAPQTTAV